MSSNVNTETVVIFKAPNDSGKEQNDIYHDILSENGFNVINVPVLEFDFVNLEGLLIKLKRPEDYSGIIFSSPRCVKACKLASETEVCPGAILARWKCQRNFAVGEATAKLAEEIEVDTSGKESGNANMLADIISKGTGEYKKPFLYPIGSLTNKNFKLKLKESDIEVDDIVIYKTKPHPKLRENLTVLLNEIIHPVYFLYFSPSGVDYTLPILKDLKFDLDRVRFVAIGPTTEKSLRENELQVYRTVSKPTPPATLQALTSQRESLINL